MKSQNSTEFNYSSFLNEEIDLGFMLNIFKRNKKLVGIISVFIFLSSLIFGKFQKKVWSGQFEIVLKDQTTEAPNMDRFQGDPTLARISGIATKRFGTREKLKTEVGVLKSQSVLMPVFDFVNFEKNKIRSSKPYGLFSSFSKNLDIELKEGTTILSINYKDVDKKLILPVLNKIKEKYQEYSFDFKKRNLDLTKEFLEDQLDLFRKKSKKSKQEVEEFALKNNLPINNQLNKDQLNSFFSSGVADIEIARIEASNQIIKFDFLLEQIRNMDNDKDIEFMSFDLPPELIEKIRNDLEEINFAIIELRSKYTAANPNLKRLEQKKQLILTSLKTKVIGFLEAQKLSAQSRAVALKRPKNVITKYRELARQSERNDNKLIELENYYLNNNLEQAKIEDPWKLITKPTLRTSYVSPNFLNLSLFGLIGGLLLGFITAFIKEKKDGLVFEMKILENALNTKVLDIFNSQNNLLKLNNKEIFFNEILNNSEGKNVKFFVDENLNTNVITNFKKFVSKNYISKKETSMDNYFIKDLSKNSNKNQLIFVTSLKSLKYSYLESLKNRFLLNDVYIMGIINIE